MAKINECKPLVSIVLNTRNRANLLPRSIASALSQTYKNFELIVVDGESTDNTKQVVEEFIDNDNRIKYLWCENKSGAFCINSGFKIAKGKYIAILDDDDEFYPTKLEKQVELFENSSPKLGIVYCWEEFWNDKTNSLIEIGKYENRGNLFSKLLYNSASGGGTLMMIKKEAIDKVGGYDDTIRFGCDYQFNLNISEYYDHDYIPEVLVRTHWYHKYVNLTTQPGSKRVNYDAVIEYYEKMLSDHLSAYSLNPLAALAKYKSIIGAASHSKKYSVLYYYLKKGLILSVPMSSKFSLLYYSIKRFTLSLINK